ncbi:thioesterase II family protein [Saccharothrix xinjiangensis]|uniref:Thioesterase II family protein n=1 Tax=Saccharothrix xinjiangensis TaxID=204798 RepID=A0ABV9YB13_9PSEU
MASDRWFRAPLPRPAARARLVCFPFAGGAASAFRDWAALLPDDVELIAVQYPGRQDRAGEDLPPDLPALADRLAAALRPLAGRSTAFLGHSMGAVVAFEVARRLRPRFPAPLARLFVSACAAPPALRPRGLRFEDGELRDYVRSMGGAGGEAVADDDLWQLVRPVLAGDLRLMESYRYDPGAPLAVPITTLAGERDQYAPPASMRAWRELSLAPTDHHVLPGGHFHFEEDLPAVVRVLAAGLGEPRSRTPEPSVVDGGRDAI